MTSLVLTKKKTSPMTDVNFYYSIEDNHTGYFIVTYENLNRHESMFVSFEATCNQFVILASKHIGHRNIEYKTDHIGFYIAPGSHKTILFEVTDIYRSDLKIGKMKADIITSFAKIGDDQTKLWLANSIEFLEKEQISRDCLYLELHENNSVYLIFLNNGEFNYQIQYTFTTLTNLKPSERVPTVIRSHSFDYFKLDVEDTNSNYEIKISYKLKPF
jgi:hypothetical protein